MAASEKIAHIFQSKPGWVFNPWLDFAAFYLPLICAFFFKLTSALDILVLKATFDIGHLFVTVLPLYFFVKAGEFNLKPLILKPIVVLLAAQVVCYFHFQLFTYIFGYYALFHICAQLYGWLARIQRFSMPKTDKFDFAFERIFLISMMLSSVLFWHTTYSTMARGWFYQGNLVVPVPAELWKIADYIFWGLLAAWVARQLFNFVVKRQFPAGKIFLLFAVWLMFYFSLIINFTGQYGVNFFWFVITVNHGLSYILFIFTTSQPKAKSRIVPYFVLYMLGIFLVGLVWNRFLKFSVTLDFRFAAVLVWGPLILHYALDSFIWRQSFLNGRLLKARTE